MIYSLCVGALMMTFTLLPLMYVSSDSIHIVRLPLHEISTCTDAQKSLPRARRIGQRVVTDHYVMLGHEQQSQNNVMPIL